MLMKTALSLAFAIAMTPLYAQQSGQVRTTPIDKVKGDPVQGGAHSEYRDDARVVQPPTRAVATPRTMQTGDIDTSTMPPPVPPQELVERSQQGIRWLCGGIGKTEAEHVKREAHRFDVVLTFVTRDGAYLADVEIEIRDDAGSLLVQTRCDGPLMLIDFPGGATYRIHARAEGQVVNRSVKIAEGQRSNRQIVMSWPVSAVAEKPGGR